MRFHGLTVLMVMAGLAAPAGLAAAAESSYTDLDLDRCQTLNQGDADEPGGDFVSLKCKGFGKYPLYFDEGDLRQSLLYGFLDQRILDNTFQTFGAFNHVGKKVEWRLDGAGKPFATILRHFIENSDPETGAPSKALEGQVLVISRVGQPNDKRGCVVGYVDALANAKPNELARQVADTMAIDFRCGSDTAAFHGERGERTSEPSSNFPELD